MTFHQLLKQKIAHSVLNHRPVSALPLISRSYVKLQKGVAQKVVATCARKLKVPGSSPAASSVHR